jgi:hypothetical protein
MVLLVMAATCALAIARLGGAESLGGQSIDERDLSRSEQLALIDQFSPVPTPRDATDIRLRYQRFQDWSFEASFTLSPEALEQYTSALQPAARTNTGASGTHRYLGKRIGAFVGWIDVDRASFRVWVHHTSS